MKYYVLILTVLQDTQLLGPYELHYALDLAEAKDAEAEVKQVVVLSDRELDYIERARKNLNSQ